MNSEPALQTDFAAGRTRDGQPEMLRFNVLAHVRLLLPAVAALRARPVLVDPNHERASSALDPGNRNIIRSI